jgi:hypothetical protein
MKNNTLKLFPKLSVLGRAQTNHPYMHTKFWEHLMPLGAQTFALLPAATGNTEI